MSGMMLSEGLELNVRDVLAEAQLNQNVYIIYNV